MTRREALAAARPADTARGATGFGPQRTDLLIADAETGRQAGLSSTGQQKSMLIGIVLGHAALIAAARGAPPLLLLHNGRTMNHGNQPGYGT